MVARSNPHVESSDTHRLIQNFDSARNIAISEANYAWLWFVDADERVSEQTGKLVNQLVSDRGAEFDAINVPFKTYFCGKWIEHSGWWPGYTMPRVLKKGAFRFSERLHGGVELNGREIRLSADPALGIDHYSYLSLEHYIEKFNRYTSTEAAQLHVAGQSIDWRNAIAHMMHDLWMYYEGNRGDLDGRHGWLLAWLSGQYRWLSHAKLLDVDPQGSEPEAQLFPGSLDDVVSIMGQELERLRMGDPILPLGVVWHSPIWDSSGYADEGRCIAKALGRLDRQVLIEEIRWSDSICEIDADDRAMLRSLIHGKRARSNISITNCIPTLASPDLAASLNVIRTTFETDRIPNEWLDHLSRFDEVWVISEHNRRAFIRSGVAPEKIRCVPSFLDTRLYRRDGPKIDLPVELCDRFVFLSVFDWQYRKGWDLLLKAYCRCFEKSDGVGLLLKISRAHGRRLDSVLDQMREHLRSIGHSLDDRADIVILDDHLSTCDMASLYRSVDAFVLPTRGEGWGRPYMEAMASGVPTIGTAASGNVDFMTNKNSVLIPANLVEVPTDAAQEISVYSGHRWYEPDIDQLTKSLKQIHQDVEFRERVALNGMEHIRTHHNIGSGRVWFGQAIDAAEGRFVRPKLAEPKDSQIKLIWEGEFFAGHSFSNINEQLAGMFFDDAKIAITLDRKVHNPTNDHQCRQLRQFQAHFDRNFGEAGGANVVVRHAFPPNWTPPESGRWIHIQPWEFGHLPQDWIQPLREQVDEIWVPSNYVRRVYENSGIPAEKIHVIPWGVDPAVFSPKVPDRLLPTVKAFRFLFVGGTIERKGYDRVLKAFTTEFSPADDVCLVVKDLGSDSFYRYGNLKVETIQARDNPSLAEIVYIDQSWTPGQVASLYNACNCLVMPYRGEGFGLPILEAMACGLPVIVPRGGASDDFVTDDAGLFLDSREVETKHEWPLVGPALELDVNNDELRSIMRLAYENSTKMMEMGQLAAAHVAKHCTWQNSFSRMRERIVANAKSAEPDLHSKAVSRVSAILCRQVTACVKTCNNESIIARCLSSLVPFVDEIVVFDGQSIDRTVAVASEYGARVIPLNSGQKFDDCGFHQYVKTDWYFWLDPGTVLSENAASEIGPLIKAQPKLATEVTMRIDKGARDNDDILSPKSLRFFRMPRLVVTPTHSP